MSKKEPVVSSTRVRAQRLGRVRINPAAGDCGCVGDEGCCKDKGCCREGKCPAEMTDLWGCAGDNFSANIRNRQDLVKDYILQNKESVAKYFKSKGVDLEH
ncbi:MAG TPA: hypothetical protein VK209_11215 [Candidatus Sulfotelmatobacter sp.]|jgi:hypothetical protein|nr:hypothetical protein [Candidatus Sulfotelmatobacter sp.]